MESDMEQLIHEIGQENRFEKIMENLPGQCRIIFSKSRFERQTYQEIADEMGLSVNTIKTQMKRALNKLRAGYKKVYANAIL
jgi:RNA polymerase sigma-70 factor, ECF subfamily